MRQYQQAAGRALRRVAQPFFRRLRDYLTGPLLGQVETLVAEARTRQKEGESVILALLCGQRIGRPLEPAPFRGLALGDGRVLAEHPALGFLYLDAGDMTVTPRVLLGTYDCGTTEALRRFVRPGCLALDVGAGQGYHTLTLASLAGRTIAVEPDPAQRALLRDNLAAHGLQARVTVCENVARLQFALREMGSVAFVRLAGPLAKEALAQLGDYLSGEEVRVMVSAPDVTGGDELASLCENLARAGLDFWQIVEYGILIPSGKEELLAGCHRPGTHVLAARGIE